MKFLLALVVAAGLASALPEPVAGGGGSWGNSKLSTKCYTSSTCKAVYYTKEKEYTKPVYVEATKTVYKPETKVTEVPKTYTTTEYYTKYTTKTKVITYTKTKPYDISTSKVVCKTYPSVIHTSKTYPVEYTKTYPEKYTESKVETETTEVPSTYVTSTPCPETYKSKSETVITKYYTETESKCWPTQSCTTKSGGWGNGGW